MTETANYKLKKPEENDWADIAVLNENADAIDTALHGKLDAEQVGVPGGVAGLDETGKVPGEQLPAMNYDPAGSADGVRAELTQEIDQLKTSVSEGKALVAAAVTDKGVPTAADATFQEIASAIDTISTLAHATADATATAAQILAGQTAYVKGSKLTGTMPNLGAISQAINAGGSYTIPAGYHNGGGKVTGNSLASQTGATATANDIASGKTAWVNGVKITGTLPKIRMGTFQPTKDVCQWESSVETTTYTIEVAVGCNNIVIVQDFSDVSADSILLYCVDGISFGKNAKGGINQFIYSNGTIGPITSGKILSRGSQYRFFAW